MTDKKQAVFSVVLGLLIGGFHLIKFPKPVEASEPIVPVRFERIQMQDLDKIKIRVYHDLESGQEFTCVYSGVDLGYSVSCFPTGRNWK